MNCTPIGLKWRRYGRKANSRSRKRRGLRLCLHVVMARDVVLNGTRTYCKRGEGTFEKTRHPKKSETRTNDAPCTPSARHLISTRRFLLVATSCTCSFTGSWLQRPPERKKITQIPSILYYKTRHYWVKTIKIEKSSSPVKWESVIKCDSKNLEEGTFEYLLISLVESWIIGLELRRLKNKPSIVSEKKALCHVFITSKWNPSKTK